MQTTLGNRFSNSELVPSFINDCLKAFRVVNDRRSFRYDVKYQEKNVFILSKDSSFHGCLIYDNFSFLKKGSECVT